MDDREKERRIAWIYWERQNLARDIQIAQRAGKTGQASVLHHRTLKLWRELAQLTGVAPN